MKALQERFQFTIDRLMNAKEFDVIGRQLSLEGYKDWEILQAACDLVMSFRIGVGGDVGLEELRRHMEEYLTQYVETDKSPFPPIEAFTVKRVRDQIHADRLARMARSQQTKPPMNKAISPEEVGEYHDPQNCIYVKTKDNYHLWTVLFPKIQPETVVLSVSDEWRIKIGCDNADSEAFRFCEDLAHDLAKYATMIDYWIDELASSRKTELNISVVGEGLFKKQFADSYRKALEGRLAIDETPIIISWRDGKGAPHMKLGVNELISQQPRIRRLFYAMCGILDTIGGLPKPDAAKKAAELTKALE